jgi:Kef-type K+ transport system membrane component KefB
MVSLASGAAAVLKLSPLLICVLSGIVFANLSTRKEKAYGLLEKGEHSLYVVFLLLAGMMFDFEWAYVWILVPAFVLLRGLAKVAGGWFCTRMLGSDPQVSKAIGVGLLYQGGLTLAIVVSLEHAYRVDFEHAGTRISPYVTTTIVFAVLVNELIAPLLAGRVLGARRRG